MKRCSIPVAVLLGLLLPTTLTAQEPDPVMASGNRWSVPLGLSIGRTFVLGGGNGLDTMIGPYFNVVRPDGASVWAIRFGISWMFP